MNRKILNCMGWGVAALSAVFAPAAGQAAGPAALAAPNGQATLGCLIEPDKVADLGSQVIGVLDGLRAERGDFVRKGQVLAQLRSDLERATADVARTRASTEADLRSSEASRELAQQKMRRAEDLVARNFIAQQALDQARADLRVAEQKVLQTREQLRVWGREVSVAEAQVGLRSIRSPFDGVVVERYLSLGERVEEKPVFRVARIDPLRVEVIVPAARYGMIRAGDVASVRPDLPGAAPLDATVSVVDRVVDAASNTFRVRLSLPNPEHRLPAGLRCRISFAESALPPAVGGSGRTIEGLRMDPGLSSLNKGR
ncbi:efflux RND transporter periplasmic adaptor subunit [Zoogloea dura]|uniref:Efflux RND transporter periplasmic adaptor subunit n=1 Tax=Zoogloea dura TaxID=2728840 RepID=A0A848FX21_9RHOO|nr:efflux RND transporter periplasmic adaptor subunit [Zoogloea dura]NML24398.1 efflux RND transporter periplasmic adaptor subunit [Zoogloea dura]